MNAPSFETIAAAEIILRHEPRVTAPQPADLGRGGF